MWPFFTALINLDFYFHKRKDHQSHIFEKFTEIYINLEKINY